MMQNRNVHSLLSYALFLFCCAWLIFLVFVTSSHEYQWMMLKIYARIPEDQQWLKKAMPVRVEYAIVFLFHFFFVCFIFLRKHKLFFVASLAVIFCYATYAFIFRDMILISRLP